ncbi:hypothetical protein JG688_00014236 [Phytophthora aleatoria]|uniref:Myb-like domain-containing protein n=1 Tax=Phytophthora aleatoria TaxID=2496075 RepID=A0A8J5ME30_9STRA|nr:hypothetical protein JG688_00014236 [Phytophthora aleatoria]
MITTSAYLRDTSGSISDPLHGHSFSPVQLRLISTVDRSLLFFRDCLLCHERLLAIGKPNNSVKLGSLPVFELRQVCTSRVSDALLFPPPGKELQSSISKNTKAHKKPEIFTLATLIEELNSSSVAAVGATSAVVAKGGATSKQQQFQTASKYAKKLAPVLAAGGVVGAIAMGPAAGVLAGLNMLVASVGAETVMAGIGLTASAAAAATVSHQSKVKAAHRRKEQLRKGEWAMEICWNCKKNFDGGPSDEACRKDAEFIRRFQLPDPRHLEENDGTEALTTSSASQETRPDDAEVYRFLFGIFASPSELLGQMNVQLCEAFRKRFAARHQKKMRRPSFTGNASAESGAARAMAKDTLQDTKMYVAHVLGATLQCCPSLASTPEAVSSCTLAVERIVYDDIHAMVFSEFQRAFKDADTSFADNLADIRREQKYHSSALLQLPQGSGNLQNSVLAEDLQKAEAKMVSMMQETSSPLLKLVLLCDAFQEHAKFLVAIKLYPHGPWRKVAAYIGTRSIRQVQTHAQKYHEKVVRRMRGLHKGRRSSGRKEHRIDDDLLAACKVGEGFGVVLPNRVEAATPSPQQQPSAPVCELMVPLLLDSMPGSTSPGGVDSNGITDTVIGSMDSMDSVIPGQLPTIDESLDFLIERLSRAGNETVKIQL